MLVRLAYTAARKITTLLELWHTRGFSAVRGNLHDQIVGPGPEPARTPSEWLRRFRPTPYLNARFRATAWPFDAPIFSWLLPVHADTPTAELRASLNAILEQPYPRWEVIVVVDGATPPDWQPLFEPFPQPQFRLLRLDGEWDETAALNLALAEATGEYAARLSTKVMVAAHALHRFAEAALASQADILFADEGITGTNPDDISEIAARPAFSYDHFLTHADLGSLVFARTGKLRQAGGFTKCADDGYLRLIESSAAVAHIPDVLSQSVTNLGPPNVESGRLARVEHFRRIGVVARVEPDRWNPGVYDVRFPVDPTARVAILIPTKNRVELLRPCIESLERTTDLGTVEIVVLDHDSDDPATLEYFHQIRDQHRVIPVTGPFNFAALMNQGAAAIRGRPTHYLFLNNDTLAPEAGWLEHMLGLACRADVGVVGATLIYPDGTIQHAGIGVSSLGGADHLFRNRRLHRNGYERSRDDRAAYLASREVTAVTAACLLIKAELFHHLNGFNELFAVEFNDVDLCIRARQAGYKVIQDSRAVLFHFEGKSRGTERVYHDDIQAFLERHRDLLPAGDLYCSPLHSMRPDIGVLQPWPVPPVDVRPRTVSVRLPHAPESIH